jgi:crotonobetainyl-CoA:carnitine CoA-transferase CaiB-like acyl-CoA transferase
MSDGALDDLFILDLSHGLAAAYCTKWFADLGANVVMVEPADKGASIRDIGPFKNDEPNQETGASHLYLNGGKKSISLSFKNEEGKSLLKQLIAKADILVEDEAPGRLGNLGLGFEDLSAINNRLIYLSITPFGQTGPYRDYPATELTLAAFSGTLAVRAISGENPICMGGYQGMYIGGRIAFLSAMGALLQRDITEAGQHVDVSLQEAIAGNDMAAPTTYSYNGIAQVPPPSANARGRGGAGRYPCKDGFVDVLPGIGGLKKLAAMLGDPELAQHELFKNHALRAEKAEEFDAEFMEPFFSTRTRAEIVEAAQAKGMPFSYVLTPDELPSEPHLVERGFFVDIEHPVAGKVTVPGSPARLTETPPKTGIAPQAGESNEAVLSEVLGIDDLSSLKNQGAL